ncbi:MAG: hypothetical protein IPO67_29940 [Deltaproteobacteria bacterium]|nr:hypothetical protein [Deltaproteobacteria bacterium]
MSIHPSTLPLTLLGLLTLLNSCDDGPEVLRAHNAEDAALNCERLAMASDWYCLPEERTIPLSCSWGDTDLFGSLTIEGSTGCVTTTCDVVLRWAEEECLYEQNGDAALHYNATNECCTSGTCGMAFGCY